MGGSSAPKTQTVTNKQEPWKGQQPFLRDLYGQAQSAYEATNKNPYAGPLVADPTSQQLAAANMTEGMVPGLTGAGNGTIDLANRTIAGDFLNVTPQLQNYVNAAIDPVQERFQEQLIPQLLSGTIASGAYGGSRDALLSAQAGQDFAREAGNIASGITYQNYSDERARQMLAPTMLQQGIDLNLMAPKLLEGVGSARQGWNQAQIDEDYQLNELKRMAPWLGLPEYAGIVGGAIPGGGTTTSPINRPSTASSIFSGALGGLGVGGSIAGALGLTGLSAFAPFLGGGAILGGLAGLL